MAEYLQQLYLDLLSFIDTLSAQSVLIIVGFMLLVTVLVTAGLMRALAERRAQLSSAHQHSLNLQHEILEQRHQAELHDQDSGRHIEHLREQLGVQRRRADTLDERLQDTRAAWQSAHNERDVALERASQLDAVREQLVELQRRFDASKTEHALVQADMAALKVKLSDEQRAGAEKLKVLEDAKERLSKEFEVLANRIFEDKSERLNKQNRQTLDATLSPLRDQLTGFRKKVEDVYDKEARERQSLLHEVSALKDLNQRMSTDALNLTRALKGDNKLQGNWGELVLERVLEDSGLHKGREYEVQVTAQGGSGGVMRPDVIVRLPDERDLVIDAKVSLVDYERYCSAIDEDEKQAALHQHVQSMRKHVIGLSTKDYAGLEGIRTLDFVFVFVPIEPAFMLAFEHDQGLFREAYERNVIVVSPTTLLATLRTVQNLWRYDAQNKNAEKIATSAGGLHDQFALVMESMQDVGLQLDRAQGSYDKMVKRFSTGKGNLVNRTKELEKLGAKTKRKLPAALQDSDTDHRVDLASDEADLEEQLAETEV